MDTKAMAYFSSINPFNRKIVSDTQMVEKILSDKWETFDVNEKEEVLDDFFVPPEVRLKYDSQEKKHSYPESFPKLKVQAGEKIIVDDANDFWTWQDEHSAPFSWKSKSQEDLCLLDIDELSKPNSKTSKPKKAVDEETNSAKPAKREFKHAPDKKSLWDDLFPQKLEEFGKDFQYDDTEQLIDRGRNDLIRDLRPESQADASRKAVNGSLNLKNGAAQEKNAAQASRERSESAASTKSKSAKSPIKSPKLSLSSSFSKKKQGDSEVLVTKRKESLPKSKSNSSFSSKEEESNAFDNPLMSSGMSSLVQDEEGYSSSTTSSPSRRPLLKEPGQQSIERETTYYVSRTGQGHIGGEGFMSTELQAVGDITKSSSEDFNDSSMPITGFDFLDEW